MITIRRSDERGHADHGWLDTFHTFSFADYYDSEHMHFGALRVLNQDRVVPGAGFPTHGHQNMEIVSLVLRGVLEHRDSMGNGSQMRPGEVQLMSAGRGVTHSEFNGSKTEPLEFLQMWVFPQRRDAAPRYEQREFPFAERRGRLRLVVSPDGADGSLTIGQDARMHAGLFDGDETDRLPIAAGRGAFVHVARGRLSLNGHELGPGDGARVQSEEQIELRGIADAEVVVWDVAV